MDAGRNFSRRLSGAAFWLGFALSGFFDGILLHQILQWHHLLSGLEGRGGALLDLRFQVLADGYFHILMYVVAAVALWLLWRARRGFDEAGAGRRVFAWLLIGFGVWHFVDAVGSHWVTQIHRIRMDADNPMLWDMGWLVAFGVIPLVAGVWLRRGGPGSGTKPAKDSAVLFLLAVTTLAAGVWAAQKPPGQDFTTVVFSPTVPPDAALSAVTGASDALWWFDAMGGVFVVSGLDDSQVLSLYAKGALLITGAGVPPGCFAWSRA